jgi:two-component SAPR family response regulator
MPELARLRAIIQPETALTTLPEEPPPVPVASTPGGGVKERRLKILALGEPAIFINEKQITRWRMARAMELVFLLLNNSGPLRKEQIIVALWPETDERVDQTLHSTIHYLRKSLGSSCVASQGGTYWLDLSSSYGDAFWYDVAAFEQHYAKARQALLGNDDETARTELLAMVELYRGDYVQSFYSDWCTFKRNKLQMAYLDARHQLALIAWRAEQVDESAFHWQHALAIDGCLEAAHYGLMRCYLRQGKRGLALRQYQQCVEALQRELSAKPGAAVQGLYQQITKSSSPRSTR